MIDDFVPAAAEPLHEQVAVWLLRQIASGHWVVHQKLPPEVTLATELGVSRVTLRRAMRELVRHGVFTQIQGRGTFVAAPLPGSITELAPPASPVDKADMRLIGVVVPSTTSAFVSEVLAHLEHALYGAGYRLLLANSQGSLALQSQHLQQLADLGVSGVVLYSGSFLHDETVASLQRRKIPLVLLDRYYPAMPTNVVASDHLRGASLATEHLLKLGHRRIGYVLGPTNIATSTLARLDGYRAVLRSYGQDDDDQLIFKTQIRPDTVEVFIHRSARPTGIVATNDVLAIEWMYMLKQLNLRVPDDIAIVGFDDIPLVSRLDPPLTTVAQNVQQLGTAAARLLIKLIEVGDQGGKPETIIIPVELIVRQSCGAGGHNSLQSEQANLMPVSLSILPGGFMS